jgi:hypothetical protein
MWRFWLKAAGAGGKMAGVEGYLPDSSGFFQRF